MELQRHIGLDGCQELGETDIVGLRLDFGLECTFQFVGMRQQVLHIAKLREQLHGRFLSYPFAARDIIRCIPHQCEQVNDLVLILQAVFSTHFFGSHLLKATGMPRTVHVYALRD